jgi:hypothetical protein
MADTQINYPQGATFETVWAILQEVGKKQEEYARQMEESKAEFDRSIKETRESQREATADFNRRLGSLTNLFGEFTESMLAPGLQNTFFDLGFDFQQANRDVVIRDKINQIFLEIDVMLENGDKAMLVEVKTKLTIERINYHISRLEKMREYADLRGDKRAFLGAIAGVVVSDEVKQYALERGFFVVEPSGETFVITPPKDNAKEW